MKSFRQYLQEQLEESSVMGYISWGLIDPRGKVIEGDDDDQETQDYGGSHQGLILKLHMSGYSDAYRRGYIRWAISKRFIDSTETTANFSFEFRDNQEKLLSAYERIKDFLTERRREINGAVFVDCEDDDYVFMADSVRNAFEQINSNIEKINSGEEDEISAPEPDARQVALMKKFKES